VSKQPEALTLKKSFDLLKANGFAPRTLFDIGVATGTTGFYQTFEDVKYVLVDPLAESEPFMRDICQRFPGAIYELAAAGAAPGEASFGVEPGLSGSSFFRKDGDKRTVPMITLDDLVEKHALEAPFLVKLDVQGYELEVLRGFERHIAKAEVIVSETGFWSDRKKSGPAPFHELVAFMAARDFMLYDIAGLARRPRDGALAEADLVFVRRDSKLREHASYRTPEQVAERQREKAAKFASQKARI
jgi:FkbM family methyltransferase